MTEAAPLLPILHSQMPLHNPQQSRRKSARPSEPVTLCRYRLPCLRAAVHGVLGLSASDADVSILQPLWRKRTQHDQIFRRFGQKQSGGESYVCNAEQVLSAIETATESND
jgi:hypothetical protein